MRRLRMVSTACSAALGLACLSWCPAYVAALPAASILASLAGWVGAYSVASGAAWVALSALAPGPTEAILRSWVGLVATVSGLAALEADRRGYSVSRPRLLLSLQALELSAPLVIPLSISVAIEEVGVRVWLTPLAAGALVLAWLVVRALRSEWTGPRR